MRPVLNIIWVEGRDDRKGFRELLHSQRGRKAAERRSAIEPVVVTMSGRNERLSDLERRCLSQGITITPQRYRILTTVAEAQAPMSVDEVWTCVRGQGDRIGRSTVNTMLGLMGKAGLLKISYSDTRGRLFR